MDKLYIVIPAYNESENIVEVIEQWYPVVEKCGAESRLVIIDDGSRDQTYAIMQEYAKDKPQFLPLTKANSGHGATLLFGYHYALENGADYIFQTDSDGQTNPDEFASFWDDRQEYDAILGHRNVRGDGRSRAFVEIVVCKLLKLYFKVDVPDANAPFRLMKTSVVANYIDRFEPDYNIPNIMLTTFFAFYKERLTFRIISFRPRQAGKNSINVIKIVKIGWKALGDFRTFKKGMKKTV